ncbi:MAG: hypothetical protein ACOX1F_00955 [Erysipelotrichaceae bacterium]
MKNIVKYNNELFEVKANKRGYTLLRLPEPVEIFEVERKDFLKLFTHDEILDEMMARGEVKNDDVEIGEPMEFLED